MNKTKRCLFFSCVSRFIFAHFCSCLGVCVTSCSVDRDSSADKSMPHSCLMAFRYRRFSLNIRRPCQQKQNKKKQKNRPLPISFSESLEVSQSRTVQRETDDQSNGRSRQRSLTFAYITDCGS